MGRKKIQISRITDERNRQVKIKLRHFPQKTLPYFVGDFQQAEVRSYEESVRVVSFVRLRDCLDYFQQQQQALPVCQHGHG